MGVAGEANFLISVLIRSDRNEVKLRTKRECGPGIPEFLVPSLERDPLAAHHQRVFPQQRKTYRINSMKCLLL